MDAPRRIRKMFVGVDAQIDPHGARPFFTKRCGEFAITQRADRVVRPYKTLCAVAVRCAGLQLRPAREGQASPLHYDETRYISERTTLLLIRLAARATFPT